MRMKRTIAAASIALLAGAGVSSVGACSVVKRLKPGACKGRSANVAQVTKGNCGGKQQATWGVRDSGKSGGKWGGK